MSDAPENSAAILTARKLLAYLAGAAAATLLVAAACSVVGVIGWHELTWYVWQIRLFRLAVAATVGAGLAVAGMALQGMLRNPLAEPYILGVSSGAGVGVLLGMALGDWFARQLHIPSIATMPVMAFVGAVLTCGIVYGIAQRRGRIDPYVLLLSGVIVNAFNGAIMLAIYLFIKPYVVSDFLAWAMGNLSYRVPGGMLLISVACILAGWAVLFLRGSAFNALGLGDDVAASTGVPVQRLRLETFALVSLMTAAAVAVAGPIGFLGLIVPHVCRLIVGPDHRSLALFSGFVGAIFLMVADTFCRTAGEWVNLSDIPVGILTAFCGGPFFIFLLRRRTGGRAR